MDLKYITLKTSVQKIIDNTIHGYRMGVWDGFYGHEYKEDVSKGIDSIVYNYLYSKGYSFGDFLKQTNEEWENV